MQATIRLAVAVVLGMTGAAVVAGPAHADAPARHEATSPLDQQADKSAVVRCPDDTVVLGVGGRTNGGGGSVLLTAIVPDQTLSTVRVSAHAIGYPGPWSVTAYAVCAPDDLVQAERVRGTGTGWSATTGCTDPHHVLYGIGFEVVSSDDATMLDALVPSPAQTQVSVHVHGVLAPTALAVYGICAAPYGNGYQRCQHTAPAPATLPTGCWLQYGYEMVYGVGGSVGSATNLNLDALVPGSGPGIDGTVRAQRLGLIVGVAPAGRAGPGLASTDGDGSTVTAYGDLIGSWY
jgi:hypothetical protein